MPSGISYISYNNEIVSFIVNNSQFHCYMFCDEIASISRKNKDKEERTVGICAGMYRHFYIDDGVTLEMHWDTEQCYFELIFFTFIYLERFLKVMSNQIPLICIAWDKWSTSLTTSVLTKRIFQ